MLAFALAGAFALSARALPLQPGLPGMATQGHSALAALLSELPVASFAAQGNGGPFVAPSWVADIVQEYGDGSLGSGKGTYAYDAAGQRWLIKTCAKNTIFHTAGDKLCMAQLGANLTGRTLLNMNTTVGEGSNSVCKAFPGPYYDMIAIFAAYAQHRGSGRVGGEPCEIWSLGMPSAGFSVSACMGSDGVPRQMNVTTGVAYKAAGSQNYTFSNPRIGPLGDEVFANSEACAHRFPMPPCPSGEEVSLTLYRTHSSREPRTLENRNLGGAMGDMAFFCDIGGIDETQLVTKWAVRANSSWGQYGYCLFANGTNVCYGNTDKHVGRESALGLGEGAVQGQCSANHDVGSWYAFPAEGHCPDGASIGTGGCTWIATPIRTVSAGCILKDRGLAEACSRDRGHAPMTNSTSIFEAALDSADPSKGGCPDAELVDLVLV
mmetsp:Transcript_50039/g.126119  ORF Transcript_50039/g.126119 Transcript_50039/m.126119 type:complete len:436 (-) Transcript_50039:265-1572(-)